MGGCSCGPVPPVTPPAQHVSERWSGNAWRTLRLPRYADLGAVQSRLENGVLSVTVGKTSGGERFGRRQVAVA